MKTFLQRIHIFMRIVQNTDVPIDDVNTIVWKNCSWYISLSSLTSTSQSFALVHAVIRCESTILCTLSFQKYFPFKIMVTLPSSIQPRLVFFACKPWQVQEKCILTVLTAVLLEQQLSSEVTERLLVRKELLLKPGGPHVHL